MRFARLLLAASFAMLLFTGRNARAQPPFPRMYVAPRLLPIPSRNPYLQRRDVTVGQPVTDGKGRFEGFESDVMKSGPVAGQGRAYKPKS